MNRTRMALISLALVASGLSAQAGDPAQAVQVQAGPQQDTGGGDGCPGTRLKRMAPMSHLADGFFTHGLIASWYRIKIVTQTRYDYCRKPGRDTIRPYYTLACYSFIVGESHDVFQGVKVSERIWQDDNNHGVHVGPFTIKDDGTVQNCALKRIPYEDRDWFYWRDTDGSMNLYHRARGEIQVMLEHDHRWIGARHEFHPNWPDTHL